MSLSIPLLRRLSLVQQIPLFRTLNIVHQYRIARRITVKHYKKGEIICRQGSPGRTFYALLSGRIQAYKLNAEGNKGDLEFIRRGMHFGIVSLLTEEKHPLTFEAINDSAVIQIEEQDFRLLLQAISRLGVELSHNLSHRLRSHSHSDKMDSDSKIIAVFSPFPHAGTEVYAANLSVQLQAQTAKSVIFVQLSALSSDPSGDPVERNSFQNNMSVHWKQPPQMLAELIGDPSRIESAICREGLPVARLHVVFNEQQETQIAHISQFLTSLVHDFEYAVVGISGGVHPIVLKTLVQADLIQLMTFSDSVSLQKTREMIGRLEEELRDHFRHENVQILLSAGEKLSALQLADINKALDFDVFLQLPDVREDEASVLQEAEDVRLVIPHLQSAYTQCCIRMARRIGGVLVGLVLGGGAALGIAHIGVLRVLEEEHIPVDVVVGSSMGALIAALWVTGSNADDLEGFAREFENGWSMLKLVDPVLPVSGLIGGRFIRHWLQRRGLKNKSFYDTRVPLKVVAYDLERRQDIVIDSGSLTEAVRRSVAIPGVVSPVRDGEQVIIDGGVLNPLPTDVLVRMGIRRIVAVNVLQSPEDVLKGLVDEQQRLRAERRVSMIRHPWRAMRFHMACWWKRVFNPNIPDIIVRSLQATEYLLSQQSAQNADLVIHPDLSGIQWFELYKVDILVKRGEEAARKALPVLRQFRNPL